MNAKRLIPILAVAVAVAVVFAGVWSPFVSAREDEPRYKMSPVENGFVRLDTDTGAMAFCTRNGEDWSCKPMIEGGGGGGDELARLRRENSNLQDEIRRMEETFGLDARGSREGAGSGLDSDGKPDDKAGGVPEIQLPDEEQVDQAVDYLERMIRKFRERFERFGERIEPRSDGQNRRQGQERERERDGQNDENSSEPRQL